jgi:outer membrane protein
MQQRFGVGPEAAAASGLPAYTAGAGVRQVYLWPALIYRVTREWYAGAGAFYQRITGDGAASPVVAERGDANQLTAGLGIGYSW